MTSFNKATKALFGDFLGGVGKYSNFVTIFLQVKQKQFEETQSHHTQTETENASQTHHHLNAEQLGTPTT